MFHIAVESKLTVGLVILLAVMVQVLGRRTELAQKLALTYIHASHGSIVACISDILGYSLTLHTSAILKFQAQPQSNLIEILNVLENNLVIIEYFLEL